jgi:hypothetical protein
MSAQSFAAAKQKNGELSQPRAGGNMKFVVGYSKMVQHTADIPSFANIKKLKSAGAASTLPQMTTDNLTELNDSKKSELTKEKKQQWKDEQDQHKGMLPLWSYKGETEEENRLLRVIDNFESGYSYPGSDPKELKILGTSSNGSFYSYGWDGMFIVVKKEESVCIHCTCCDNDIDLCEAKDLANHAAYCDNTPLLVPYIIDAMKSVGEELREESVEVDFKLLDEEQLKKRIAAMWEGGDGSRVAQIRYVRRMIVEYLTRYSGASHLSAVIFKRFNPSYDVNQTKKHWSKERRVSILGFVFFAT